MLWHFFFHFQIFLLFRVDSHLHTHNDSPTANILIDVTKFQLSSDSDAPIRRQSISPEQKVENTHFGSNENNARISPVMTHDKSDTPVSNITNEYKYKTLSRMRTFEVDGQVITTRTTRIIEIDKSNNLVEYSQDSAHKKLKDLRHSQVRELKQLQREEQSDCQILIEHIKQEKETKEVQQYQEKIDLDKRWLFYVFSSFSDNQYSLILSRKLCYFAMFTGCLNSSLPFCIKTIPWHLIHS